MANLRASNSRLSSVVAPCPIGRVLPARPSELVIARVPRGTLACANEGICRRLGHWTSFRDRPLGQQEVRQHRIVRAVRPVFQRLGV